MIKKRNKLWPRGRKLAKEKLKAYVSDVLTNMRTPVELTEYHPGRDIDAIYEEAFDEEIAKHPEWYGADADHSLCNALVAEPKSMRQGNAHLPFFKSFYKQNIKGKRFADQMPGKTRYEGLSLTQRNQDTRLNSLNPVNEMDPSRVLTQKMRDEGMERPEKYWVPENAEDYQARQQAKEAAAAATQAE